MLEIRDPLAMTAVVSEHLRRNADFTPSYVTVYVSNLDDDYFVFSLSGLQLVPPRKDGLKEEMITYYCTAKKVE